MNANLINATLPIQIKVLERHGLGHYTLLLNTKKMKTKSMIELELNQTYLAELYLGDGGVMAFKNLIKCPQIKPLNRGLEFLINILENNMDFKKEVIKALLTSKDKSEFEVLKTMLLASFDRIYHIPFVFDNNPCVFQLKKNLDNLEIYLYFSVFGAMKIFIKENEISIFTPFLKVQKFLNENLKFSVLHDAKLKPLFEPKLSFKG